MTLENTIQALENIRQQMKAMTTDRDETQKYLAFINAELNKLSNQEKELQEQSVGAYKGRSNWSHQESVETRREIRRVLSKAMTVGEICEALPTIERNLIEKELDKLIELNAIGWNGKRGPVSKYQRV